MISAVDLLKGIGVGTGMEVIEVPDVTGNIDTNFDGKAQAAIDALSRGNDLVYIHVEAADECGHHGDAKNKIFSIEQIDELVVKPIFETLTAKGEPFKLLICPDHPTPLSIMTHCKEPVPYLIYDSEQKVNGTKAYDEEQAEKTGVFIENGVMLMQRLLDKKD